jgi:hypothetical protein
MEDISKTEHSVKKRKSKLLKPLDLNKNDKINPETVK